MDRPCGICEGLSQKVSAKEPEYKAYVCSRYASSGKNACSSHYINQKVLTQIVMTDIRCKAMRAQNSRETPRMQLLAREQNASVERTRTLQAELTAIGKRLPELDKLIQSAYEDKVLGRIPESVCVNLLNQYEAERREKQDRRKELTEQLAASRETESSADAWLDMMQDYAQLEELDRPTLVRLIQKIEISERYPWTTTRNGTFTSTTILSDISKHKASFFIRGCLTRSSVIDAKSPAYSSASLPHWLLFLPC